MWETNNIKNYEKVMATISRFQIDRENKNQFIINDEAQEYLKKLCSDVQASFTRDEEVQSFVRNNPNRKSEFAQAGLEGMVEYFKQHASTIFSGVQSRIEVVLNTVAYAKLVAFQRVEQNRENGDEKRNSSHTE